MTTSLITASGTGSDYDSGYQYDVATGVDQDLYTWRPIMYPSGGVYLSGDISLDDSVDVGVSMGIALINANAGPFSLVGYSQGAKVASLLLKELQSGSLTSRMADLRGSVMFGNPMRQSGHTFPNGRNPGGQGIDTVNTLTDTPSLWWEMVTTRDIVSNIPLGGAGDIIHDVWVALSQLHVPTMGDLLSGIVDALMGPAGTGHLIRDLLSNPLVAGPNLAQAARFAFGAAGGFQTSGHSAYETRPAWPNSTYVQAGIAHLNGLSEGPVMTSGFTARNSVTPELKKIKDGTDGVTKWRLLDARRQLVIDGGRQRPLLRLMDKKMNYLGTVGLEKSASFERLMDDSGVGSITLRWSDWLANLCAHDTRVQEDLHLLIDPNPNQRSWRTRLGYRVTAVRAVKHDDGTRIVELDLISLREHAKHILLGATPFSAPEFQPLKTWVWFQNLRSNLAFTTFINLARSYWPPLSLPTSLFDPAHWLTTKVGNLSPLHWPVQVQFVNPITDTSRFLPLAAKWQDLHTISEPLMDDAGVCLVDYIWLPEDKDSPHPELAAIVGEQLARPTRACVILAFEDKSGIVGPTGTAIDGVLNLIGATLDDLITEVVLPLDSNNDGITDPFFRRLLGVAPKKPSLVWRDCEYSGLITSSHKLQRGTSQTVWTGGHSPTWLNQVQTFLIRYALSQISALIAQGPFAAQLPGSSGLENVYQGQLDDIMFAYQKSTNLKTALWFNDYALLEGFEQGNGYAYVLSAALTIRQGIFKRSPKVSFTLNAKDGEPWCWGYDYTVGDRGLFEIDGIYYTEQIRGAKWSYDENKPIDLALTIGRERERDPFEAGMKALADGWNAIGSLVGGASVAV